MSANERLQELVIKNFQILLPDFVNLLAEIGSEESETVSTIYQARLLKARFNSLLAAIKELSETQLDSTQQADMYKDLKRLLGILTEPLRLMVETLLLVSVVVLIFKRSYKIQLNEDRSPTQKKLYEAIAEYQPEPLVTAEMLKNTASNLSIHNNSMISTGASKPHMDFNGKTYFNLATRGALNYQFHPDILKNAEKALRSYGVGPCGPRGFYGTHVTHLELESRVAEFMDSESAVIYSSSFVAISSLIPAFCKPGDYLFVDSGVNFSIQNGIKLSRTSKVFWFAHNKMNALEHLLRTQKEIFDGSKRVFVIVEGLYSNYVDVCPLPELLELKEVYPFRIIMDESHSIGVMGSHGRGITEHFGVPSKSLEFIAGSFCNAIGMFGGFVVGSLVVGNHQRLSASGYCFSCSTPPFLVTSTIQALDFLERGYDVVKLQKKCRFFHQQLNSIIKSLRVFHCPNAPFAHIRLLNLKNHLNDEKLLSSIVNELNEQFQIIAVFIPRLPYERSPPHPSIQISISVDHEEEEITKSLNAIEMLASKIVSSH